ncbi:MAG TPA: protein-glutamate O-methyltransferase CheR [Alphaproteobacteria bacterium]
MKDEDVEQIEIDLLLEGIRRRWGYDFRNYSPASLGRRLEHARKEGGYPHLTALLDGLLHDEGEFEKFLKYMSITVTEMFRDPPFYAAVREKLVPLLKTFPFVKIWHAGCATGEEVYSMAILLHEENFLDRVRLYATDFNKYSLDVAEEGVYPLHNIEAYALNYHEAGGKGKLEDYYSAKYDLGKMKDFLKKNITFSYHNLVTDSVFGEMNLICCRNVLIYFDKVLQDRALNLFNDSLRHGGFLCLGSKETINFSSVKKDFETVDSKQRLYRKRSATHV